MNGVAAGMPRHSDDLFDGKIAFARGRRADRVSFAGEPHMQRRAIDITEDSCGANVEFLAGAQDANRNLASIGDQDFSKRAPSAHDADSSMGVRPNLAGFAEAAMIPDEVQA